MPNFGVNVAILSAGKVLLTRREDFEVWCLPGGGVEAGESYGQAARREALEETGLEVEIERLVGLYSKPHFVNGGSHVALFAAHQTGWALHPDPREVIETGWFDMHNLPADLFPGDLQQIRDALGGVGGSAVWRQEVCWPFPQDVGRSEVYRQRDESGLARLEFYRRYFSALEAVEVLETHPDP